MQPAISPATGQPASPPVYAGFWRRFFAYLVDALIVNTLLLGMVLAAPATAQSGPGWHYLASVVVHWLYWAVQEASPRQATVGKRWLGVRVTDTGGGRISFARATGREFGKYVSGFILMIGFIMAAFTARRQALHDLMAGTLVLRGPPAPEGPGHPAGPRWE